MQELTLQTKVPVLSWADPESIDRGSMDQITNLANLPFAYHHIALMADVHVGYGMPIGGILASDNYVSPNAVGVDIGCGMVALKTSIIKDEFLKNGKEIGEEIFRTIPLGFKKHRDPQLHEILKKIPSISFISEASDNIAK